jgi:5-formyltetrahydrofolate cyclo-ligase
MSDSYCQLSKNQLRNELRQRRQALSQQTRTIAAAVVGANFEQLPRWTEARSIGLYLANDGEIDTLPLSRLCRGRGMQLYLPVINSDTSLNFAEWAADSELSGNRFGIGEPPAAAPRCPVDALDILVLPVVGWDRRGGRLGMGGGFYDRSLAAAQGPLLVGLAYSVQELPRVPTDAWDIFMDFIVTEAALHRCQVLN